MKKIFYGFLKSNGQKSLFIDFQTVVTEFSFGA